jgi:hypothetical protein
VISESPFGVLSEDGRINTGSSPHIFWYLLTLSKLQTTPVSSDAFPEVKNSCQGNAHQTSLDWLDLIEHYTRCDLTKEEDKLVAIAGMAGKIRSRICARWCAGIWSDYISEGLLWLSGHDMSRPVEARAPSWSWAAWDGPVQYPGDVKSKNYVPRALFESIRKPGSLPDQTAESWLAGPGILRIQAHMIALSSVFLTGDFIQLGPGLDRRGYFTSDCKDLPRLRLKHYLTVHTLRGRRKTNKRLLIREDQLPPCGWVALDDSCFALM